MAQPTVESIVKQTLISAIDEKARILREELIRKMVQEFESKLRSAVMGIAIDYGQFFSVQTMGAETIIHVKVSGNWRGDTGKDSQS